MPGRLGPRTSFIGIASMALIGYGWFLCRHVCFAVGGSDSSGYANTARALSRGALVEPIDALAESASIEPEVPIFIPLGYVPGSQPRTMAPLYPVGFPLHLAAAGVLLEWSFAPYMVSPVAALLCLAVLFLLGRRLGLSRWASAGASAILAACPVFIFQAIQPMSDVVATFWCLAAVLCAVRSREDWRWSALAGFSFGVSVLVRPIDILILLPLGFAIPLDRRRIGAFLAGGLPPAVGFAAFNLAAYGAPFETGYGVYGLSSELAWSHVPQRLSQYARWTVRILTAIVAVGWLAALPNRRIPRRDRALLFSWFAIFFAFHCFYAPADAWWFTRYLLPGLPALPLGFLLAMRDATGAVSRQPQWPSWRPAGVFLHALLVVLVCVIGFRRAKRDGVLDLHRQQAVIPASCARARALLPPGSLVVSRELSGALHYYTDLTPVRWDYLDATRFQELRRASERMDRPWFALLMSHEVLPAAPRVPGRWTFLEENGPISLWRLEAP